MCLTRQREFLLPDDFTGYKVFYRVWDHSMEKTVYQTPYCGTGRYLPGEEYHELHSRGCGCSDLLYDNEGVPYDTGFHLFPAIEDAADYAANIRDSRASGYGEVPVVVCRVRFNRVTAKGIQRINDGKGFARSCDTLVARYITILEEVQ